MSSTTRAARCWEQQGGHDQSAAGNRLRSHSTAKGGARQVYSGARVVGHIDADGWLVKTGLDPRKHKVRVPPGWATDTEHLLLPIKGVRLLLVDGTVLEAPLATWRRFGKPINRGCGPQTLLVDEHWRVWRPGEHPAEQLGLEGF